MTINHHPSDAVLLAFAAGKLSEGLALAVTLHLSACPECREVIGAAECAAGAALDNLEPCQLETGSFDRVLARLDDTREVPVHLHLPASIPMAEALLEPMQRWLGKPVDQARWRWLAPGIRQVEVCRRSARGGVARLLRIAPGTSLPHHGHTGTELTVVLRGSFSDEFGRYCPGDIAEVDEDSRHQPIADSDVDCLCLIATESPLRFTGLVGRFLQPFVQI